MQQPVRADASDVETLGPVIGQSPLRIGVQTIVVCCLLFALLGTMAFDFANNTARKRAELGMRDLCEALASQVDMQLHERLVDASQISGADYRDALAPLVRSHLVLKKIRNVYTMRYRDGALWYVLDTSNAPELAGRTTDPMPLMYRLTTDMSEFTDMLAAALAGESYVDPAPHLDHGVGESQRSVQAPLYDAKGNVVGVLGIDYTESDFLQEVHGWVIGIFAVAGVAGLSVALLLAAFFFLLRRQLGNVVHELGVESNTDALTGLLNRRSFNARLERHLSHARRQRHALTLLLVDVDHFKRVNDAHGHAVGDAVLAMIANKLRETTRDDDPVCRIGGEEFAVIMSQTSAAEAQALFQRLSRAIGTSQRIGGASVAVTVSGGIAGWQAPDERPDVLFWRADQALYRAKREGRDRCVVADSDALDTPVAEA